VARTKPKTKYVAEISLQEFVHQNEGHCYWWTFTEPGRFRDPMPSCPIQRRERESFIGPLQDYWTKDEAEEHFKPFRDLCLRRGWKCIIVWEQQKRGSWHPHLFIDHRIDVNFLRPFMMKRGWGQQMRVDLLDRHRKWIGYRWVTVKGDTSRRVNYAIKYLGKNLQDEACKRKKRFSCVGKGVKKGSTQFRWNPHFIDHSDERNTTPSRPGAYLYAMITIVSETYLVQLSRFAFSFSATCSARNSATNRFN